MVASCTPPNGDLAHNPGRCPKQESNWCIFTQPVSHTSQVIFLNFETTLNLPLSSNPIPIPSSHHSHCVASQEKKQNQKPKLGTIRKNFSNFQQPNLQTFLHLHLFLPPPTFLLSSSDYGSERIWLNAKGQTPHSLPFSVILTHISSISLSIGSFSSIFNQI